MEKILITGGAGFIGSHLAEYYLKNSDDFIFILDNFNSYYDPNKKRNNIEILKKIDKNHHLQIIEGDIRDKDLLDTLFKKNVFKTIFHLAAMAGVRYSIENPELYYEVNLYGTLNLLNTARRYNSKNFIFASSSSVYGNRADIPFSENMNVDCPISPYAATKKAGEELCFLYHHLYDFNVTCLRFFTVYGPRGRPDMAVYKFINNIVNGIPIEKYGTGYTMRDYTYIDDIIEGIILVSKKNFSYEIFNLGRGEITNLNDFISIIEKNAKRKAIINQKQKQLGDVDITLAKIDKAKEKVGYNPKISIDDGIKKTFDWYINH